MPVLLLVVEQQKAVCQSAAAGACDPASSTEGASGREAVTWLSPDAACLLFGLPRKGVHGAASGVWPAFDGLGSDGAWRSRPGKGGGPKDAGRVGQGAPAPAL